MSETRQKRSSEAYWKYLEENSRVVATWPEWLKGQGRSASAPEKAVTQDAKSEGSDCQCGKK
jgi:hypothetical protein